MNTTTIIIGIVILVFIFLLTYDPKTRRLEKYLTSPGQAVKNAMETEPLPPNCSVDRYYELQFNKKSNGEGCAGDPDEYMGAVIYS
jgi:hypothetical protein